MDLTVKQFGSEQTQPSYRFGPHVRDHYLIHYVLHGKGILIAEGLTHSICAGQAFVIFPGQVAVYQADTEKPWYYAWVGFLGRDAAAIIAEAGATYSHPVVNCRHNLLSVVQQMQKDIELSSHPIALTGGLMRFLALMIDTVSSDQSPAQILYEKALWYFRSNYPRLVTIHETASYVGLSRSQLFRIFRAISGQSPKQALTALRLEEAYRLLLETILSIEEIAYAIGIPSPSRFCTIFTSRYGLPPSKLRTRTGYISR